jgi:hypothetical protein
MRDLKLILVAVAAVAALWALEALLGGPAPLPFLRKLGLFVGLPLLLAGWVARQLLGAARFRRVLLRISILVLASVMALALGELGVRWLLRDMGSTGDGTSWFARRWSSTVRVNAAGFRDAEFTPHPAPGRYRISVIGDSLAYGQGIEEWQRFTDRIETALNDRAGRDRFELLNFGRSGSETKDHLAILDEVIEGSSPDYVLLQWYRNDVEGADKSRRPRPIPLVPSERLTRWLARHSALYYLLNVRWTDVQERIGLVGSYEDYIIQRFGDPQGADWQRADRLLREFAAGAREAGVPVGVVLFRKLTPLNPLRFLHERVMEICAEEELECLDLDPVFSALPDPQVLWANPLDAHPGPEAHRVAAESILERYAPLWNAAADAKDEAAAARQPTTEEPS